MRLNLILSEWANLLQSFNSKSVCFSLSILKLSFCFVLNCQLISPTGALTSFSICMDLPTTLAPPTPPEKVTPKPPPVKQPTTPSPGNLNIINATVMTKDVLTGTMAEQPTSGTETTRLPDVTTRSTTKDHVGEKAVSSSKTAGIAVAACLVSIGIICAAVLFVLHLLKERTTKEAAIRPDTKGAQKGTKTTTSPA